MCPTEHEITAKFRHHEKLDVPGKQHGISNLKENFRIKVIDKMSSQNKSVIQRVLDVPKDILKSLSLSVRLYA
jgi:hypothetical protein